LLEIDFLFTHPNRQPVVLIEADTRRERKVRAQAHEHPSPAGIVEVEVVLDDPTLSHLEVPSIVFLVAIGDQDSPRLTRSENRYDLVRLGLLEIRIDEIVASSIRRLQYWHAPLLRPVCHPILVLLSDTTEFIARDTLAVAIGVEESDHSFWLLERLNQSVQQQPVKAPVVEPDAILVMLEKGVHRHSSVVRYLELSYERLLRLKRDIKGGALG